jgi:hypothetical protein
MTDSEKGVYKFLKRKSKDNDNMKLIQDLFREEIRSRQINNRFKAIR